MFLVHRGPPQQEKARLLEEGLDPVEEFQRKLQVQRIYQEVETEPPYALRTLYYCVAAVRGRGGSDAGARPAGEEAKGPCHHHRRAGGRAGHWYTPLIIYSVKGVFFWSARSRTNAKKSVIHCTVSKSSAWLPPSLSSSPSASLSTSFEFHFYCYHRNSLST